MQVKRMRRRVEEVFKEMENFQESVLLTERKWNLQRTPSTSTTENQEKENSLENIPLNERKPTPSTSTAQNQEMENVRKIIPRNEMTVTTTANNALDDEENQMCAKLKKYLRKCLPFGRKVFLLTLIGWIAHIIDLILDILVTKDFYECGEVVLTILSSVFIGLPYLCNLIFSLLGFMIISRETPRTKKPWCALIALHIPPIVPFLWYFPPVDLVCSDTKKMTKRSRKINYHLASFTVRVVLPLLLFTECFLESIPQFLLQSFNLLTSPAEKSVGFLKVGSVVWSLLTMSWASSNLWFTIREQMYFPCPCGYFQLSSCLYCLSNLLMLSGRLLTLSAFAASVGPMPLLYVLLANACIAGLTELYICWGNAERSKPSKANIITRIVEFLCLVFDVPFSITFMMGHAAIGCYCFWTVETLVLDVFAYFWSISQQTVTAANKSSNRLQSSASLQTALLVITIVFATVGVVLRYVHFRKELNNLKILDQDICDFDKVLQPHAHFQEDFHLALDLFKEATAAMRTPSPDGDLIKNKLSITETILDELIKKTRLNRVIFAKKLREELQRIREELVNFQSQKVFTNTPEDWLKFAPIGSKLDLLSVELEDLCSYFQRNRHLHEKSSLHACRKTLDAFAANIFLGHENWFVLKEDPVVSGGSKVFPRIWHHRQPNNCLHAITFAFFPANVLILCPYTRLVWPTRRDAYKHFENSSSGAEVMELTQV